MAYSKAKPYNKTTYKGATDPSYDRYLKEAVNAGKAENVKESELEKPYNVKQTYGAMQQDYNIPTPPVIDPGPGTGGLKCLWVSTGCEQLVGCWAGSDIVLDGPEAATAGYMSTTVIEGDIVSETIGGSEGRAIELVLNPLVTRNTLRVNFKDGLGVTHTSDLDIECSITDLWTRIELEGDGYFPGSNTGIVIDQTNGNAHICYMTTESPYDKRYAFFNGTTVAKETYATGVSYAGYSADIHLNSLSEPVIATFKAGDAGTDVVILVKSSGSWSETLVYDAAAYVAYENITLLKDSSDYFHIIYGGIKTADKRYGVVYHSTNASGSWLTEEILNYDVSDIILNPYGDPLNEILPFAVIDSSDNIHVLTSSSFPNGGVYLLHYTYGTYGSWAVDSTLISDNNNSYFDVDISPNDTIGILYDFSNSCYRSLPVGGALSSEETISTVASINLGNISFDNSNVAQVTGSLYSSGVELLRHYSRAGGTWAQVYISQLYDAYGQGDSAVWLSQGILYVVSMTSSLTSPTQNGTALFYKHI